jgi:two-component system, NarL family, sensor histidine kinase YdfH
MKVQPSSRLRNIENDPRLLFWFGMAVILVMFVWSFFYNPNLRRPGPFVLYVALFGVHLYLHWRIYWLEKHRNWLACYTVLQGAIAFGIAYLAGNIGMVFCLFMALSGELLSIYRITIRGILVTVYLLSLAFINFIILVGIKQAGWFALGTLPILVFVTFYVILYTRQTEANARARELLKELEAANCQLTEYSARVEDLTIVAERQRMARELHDTLSQGLAGLILQLEAVDAHLAGNRPERARLILEQSMAKARETLAEARRAIADLRQEMPHDLEGAVRREIAHFIDSTGIPCTQEIELPLHIPEQVVEAATRATAEALTNVALHASARNVKLSAAGIEGGNELEIQISDDGIGFDPALVEAGHYGLLGMRERVRLVGGSCEIHSAVGSGTCIRIRFPLKAVANG